MLSELFDQDYIKRPILMTGTIRHYEGSPLIVKPNDINQLLKDKICHKEIRGNKVYKVLRFLLRTDGELVFAHEGCPNGLIPAHWHMTGAARVFDASCITAGNVFFDENNTLQIINHKSGDFRPAFDSLQFVFPELIKAISLDKTLEIQKLYLSGALEQTYKIAHKDIQTFYEDQQTNCPQEKISTSERKNRFATLRDLGKNFFFSRKKTSQEDFNQNELKGKFEDDENTSQILKYPCKTKTIAVR
ncbi:hypothetical protein Lsan_3503 [Legionella santicrucis]|uniref:Uncharacterized protein n=1 Tax=Legionella santicrucis TaxID=45074 RepID=A0A0W0YAT1_9GAMM|nr:hypothetical protein [Legionella santicrucis]KTD53839.1 hypothetical protein Lsan_3503 [Legionella santicrucis]